MKKILIFILLLLTGCSHYTYTSQTNSVVDNKTEIKEHYIFSSKNKLIVAVLLPLDGQYKDISEGIIYAIQLAYNNCTKKNIIMRFYNTYVNGKDVTVNATKEAINGGADIILGPLFATHLNSIAKLTTKKNIPVISFSNDRSALINTNNIYIIGYAPEIEVERIIDYVSNTQQATRFVAMVPENKYGNIVLSSLKATLEARGLSLVRVVTYPPDTINFSPYIVKLLDPDALREYEISVKDFNNKHYNSSGSLVEAKNYPNLRLDFDTLFVGDTGSRLMLLGVHLPYIGINTNKINFIGTRLLSNANLYNEKVFRKLLFPDFIDLQNTIFASKFSSIFKVKPTLISAAAYDIVQMIMSLVKFDSSTGEIHYDFSPENFTNKRMFGVLGNFSLRKDGLTERDMEIKGTTSKEYYVVDDTSGYDFIAVKNYKDIPINVPFIN